MKLCEKKIEKLKNGDFSDVSLNFWFENQQFEYILATVLGCDKNLDYDMLNFITLYAKYYLKNPNANEWQEEGLRVKINNSSSIPFGIDEMSYEKMVDYWNEQIVKSCRKVLKEVILVGSKHTNDYLPILIGLYDSEDEFVRLHCAANLTYYEYINDVSPRIRRVAEMKMHFYLKWCNLCEYDDERKRIEFLASALEKGVIGIYDGDVRFEETDMMNIGLSSLLFEKGYRNSGYFYDLVYTIQDKKVLADRINELIKDGQIVLREELVPDYFLEKKDDATLKLNK